MTQVELAKQAGVTSRWLREVEHGKATAEVGLVLRIMGFLGLELQITNRDENKATAPVDSDYPDIDKILREM
jgi:transcriptional regulator with XRE-family HTH domain